MITHVALIGSEAVVGEFRPPAVSDPAGEPTIALMLGPTLALHLPIDLAEQIADALVGAVADAADAVTPAGPTAYLPTWAPA